MAGVTGKRTVEAGYDQVADQYLSTKDAEDPNTLAALEDLASDWQKEPPSSTWDAVPGYPQRAGFPNVFS